MSDENELVLPPRNVTPEQLYGLLIQLNTRVGVSIAEANRQSKRLEEVETEMKELTEAWNAIGALATFIKFIASVLGGIAVVWGAVEVVLRLLKGIK